MKLEELVRECAAAANDRSGVVIVLPRQTRDERIRLVPGRRKCPMGEVLQEREDGTTLARFDPMDVLAFFTASGVVKAQVKDGRTP